MSVEKMGVEVRERTIEEIEGWRKAREDALRAPDGWLSLVGLFMLADGDYSLGSDESNMIQLPASVPAQLGTLAYRQGKAMLEVSADAPVFVDGVPVWSVEMVDYSAGRQPTLVKVDSVSFNLHRFGDEVALRVRDSASPAMQEFGGCEWYEIKPEYRVQGRLVRQDTPSVITVNTSVKTLTQFQSVGAIEFELLGQSFRLLASAAGKPDELFIIMRDATAGQTTYGAGRYLYAPVDEAGNVLLDFNKAYNPPCAFTPYATCSLPPAENLLKVAVEAGELYSP